MSYKELKSYQNATIIYDFSVEFCSLYIEHYSRTHDQMVQAARSGKQNIVEGSQASRTSKKTELKLLGVARSSLTELLEDYEDFLRQKSLPLWEKDSKNAKDIRSLAYRTYKSYESYKSYIGDKEQAANAMICLINQTNFLLDRQINSLEDKFLNAGGYTESLFKRRQEARGGGRKNIGPIGLISLIGLIALAGLLLARPAKAEEAVLPTVDSAEATVLTITPSIFEGVVAPGKTTSQVFELKNGSNFPLPIKSYIRTFEASDEEGGVAISDQIDLNRLSPASWTQIVEPDFVLQPQSSRQVKVNFSPPVDLPPGGYYAIFFAEPLIPESFLSQSSLQIGGRLGSLMFLIGPGDTIEKGSIASFGLPKYIWRSGSTEANVRFQNTGNVHLRPSGKIIVTNIITKTKKEFEVKEFTALPGKIRQQKVSLANVKWPGKYKAELQINYGRDKIPVTTGLTFYHLPMLQFVVMLVLTAVAVGFLWHKPRRRILRAIRIIIKGEKSGRL